MCLIPSGIQVRMAPAFSWTLCPVTSSQRGPQPLQEYPPNPLLGRRRDLATLHCITHVMGVLRLFSVCDQSTQGEAALAHLLGHFHISKPLQYPMEPPLSPLCEPHYAANISSMGSFANAKTAWGGGGGDKAASPHKQKRACVKI